MSTHGNTLPELDQRLVAERGALLHTVEALRGRVRKDINDLRPKQQMKRHPGAALAAVAVAGLLAGRIAGGVLAALLK